MLTLKEKFDKIKDAQEAERLLIKRQKRNAVIWFIVTMLINFTLLACAWVKTVQHQNNAAFNYIMVFLVVNIIASHVHGAMAKRLII